MQQLHNLECLLVVARVDDLLAHADAPEGAIGLAPLCRTHTKPARIHLDMVAVESRCAPLPDRAYAGDYDNEADERHRGDERETPPGHFRLLGENEQGNAGHHEEEQGKSKEHFSEHLGRRQVDILRERVNIHGERPEPHALAQCKASRFPQVHLAHGIGQNRLSRLTQRGLDLRVC